jgi:hypothetical protein
MKQEDRQLKILVAMRGIVQALADSREAEEAYAGRIPESLESGLACEDAEAAVYAMDEALALLEEAYRRKGTFLPAWASMVLPMA